ncbi:MAG TPA: hypothetical protein EYQ21_06690 [Flavobacteriales bacterium]|nr:hypothetical protein [Flavobacteriales bacterium]
MELLSYHDTRRQRLRDLDIQIALHQNEGGKISNLKKEIENKKTTLSNLESSILRRKKQKQNTIATRTATELKIDNLRESIEETYESIKHLIPYSDYL